MFIHRCRRYVERICLYRKYHFLLRYILYNRLIEHEPFVKYCPPERADAFIIEFSLNSSIITIANSAPIFARFQRFCTVATQYFVNVLTLRSKSSSVKGLEIKVSAPSCSQTVRSRGDCEVVNMTTGNELYN